MLGIPFYYRQHQHHHHHHVQMLSVRDFGERRNIQPADPVSWLVFKPATSYPAAGTLTTSSLIYFLALRTLKLNRT
jgi:hypothetical protein